MRLRNLFISILSIAFLQVFAQQTAIGQWSSHIPHNKGLAVCEAEDKIYCLTETGLFYYNTGDNSIQKIGKIEGMSGINTTALHYHEGTKTLYVGYLDGTIDLIDKNNKISTLNDITRKSFTSKTINKIQCIDDRIYFSTNFGIVVYNPYKEEFIETYIIGNNGYELQVNAVTSDSTFLYAATENGVKKALKSSNQLPNYANWTLVDIYPSYTKGVNAIAFYNNKLIVSQINQWAYTYKTYAIDPQINSYELMNPDSENYTQEIKVIDNKLMLIHKKHISFYTDNLQVPDLFINSTSVSWGSIELETYDAILSKDGALWYADNNRGLVRNNYNGFTSTFKQPNSPVSNNSYYLYSGSESLWMVYGAIEETGVNTSTKPEISRYKNGEWYSYNYSNIPELTGAKDLISIEESKYNSNKIICSSGTSGVFEIDFTDNNNPIVLHHNDTSGSSLSPQYGHRVQVVDAKMDEQNNIWVTNPYTSNPFQVKLPSGDWIKMPYGNLSTNYGRFIIASDGSKWIIGKQGKGLYIFNDFGTIENFEDDFHKDQLDILDENQEVINNNVYAIAEDKNQQIWLGTFNGIVVYFNPSYIYDNNPSTFYASKITIDLNGKIEYLMEGKKVISITVDGANRKWIGTEQSGVFLVSEDGTEQILHFNTENSPLPSNKINSIAIDKHTGEVFIATGQGLMSYRGDATDGNEFFKDVYTFPNPVKPDYDGPITITGLMENSTIKITDISGNLVCELNSLGGQAIWDGKNLNGNRVKTGIYLVFLNDETGESTAITKILFIN